jgi:hypothetical protein
MAYSGTALLYFYVTKGNKYENTEAGTIYSRGNSQ